jgi:hypothetical protein
LAELLRQVRSALDDLLVSMARLDRHGTQVAGTGASHHALPVNLAAGSVYTGLSATLRQWAVVPVQPGGLWVSESVRRLRRDTTVLTAWDRLDADLCVAQRIVDRPDMLFLGICSAPEADVYADAAESVSQCVRCRTVHDVAQRRAVLLAAVEDVWTTTAELSRAILWLTDQVVSPVLIRKWVNRGKLSARGVTSSGQPLYRIGDGLDIVRARSRAQ